VDGTRSALIIASDDYTDPGLRRLRAPASDAQALAGVLRDPGIGGFEVRTLLNAPAHEVNLAVEEFFADRRPDDLLLLHVSCHGVKDEGGELYFATANTRLRRLGATAVAAEFVNRRMNRSRSRRVVLLLDCCYAGAFERGMTARAGPDVGIEEQFGGRGRAVITASSAMEYAFEGEELADTLQAAPSVFTSALVEGLETGEADRDQDGMVALDELYDFVYDRVRAATPHQTPSKWTFGVQGDLYIARRARPVTTPAPLPPELQEAIQSPFAGIRIGAVHELERLLQARHAGLALAARQALERLADDDSRMVSAAATEALAPAEAVPGPVAPRPPASATASPAVRAPSEPALLPPPLAPEPDGPPPREADRTPVKDKPAKATPGPILADNQGHAPASDADAGALEANGADIGLSAPSDTHGAAKLAVPRGAAPGGLSARKPSPLALGSAVALLMVLGALVVFVAARDRDGGNQGVATRAGARTACNDQFGCLTLASGEPIKLGTLLSITGGNRSVGIDSQRGVQLAVDYLDGKLDGKAGQLLGRNVKLVHADEACSKKGGQTGATKLAADPKLLSVIGTSCAGASLGVADTIFSKKGILLISPSSTGPAQTAEGQHQAFYLRTVHNDKIQSAVVADFAIKKLKAKTAATIHAQSPYSDGLAATFRQVFEKQGGKITNDEAIRSTDRDLKSVLNRIAKNKPDFLYYPAFLPACAQIGKQGRAISGLANTAFMTSDGCAAPEYVRVGGRGVYGTWVSVPDVTAQADQNAFYGQQFLPAYQKQFGERPISTFNAHAYDAANILFEALKRTASEDGGTLTISRTRLKDEVYKTSNYKGLSGTISCTPSGDCATAVSIEVYKVPDWPIEGGNPNAKPVFTETKTTAEVSG
jgi:ABC-type branched-subunit amino acid transport system substrate-binding protein